MGQPGKPSSGVDREANAWTFWIKMEPPETDATVSSVRSVKPGFLQDSLERCSQVPLSYCFFTIRSRSTLSYFDKLKWALSHCSLRPFQPACYFRPLQVWFFDYTLDTPLQCRIRHLHVWVMGTTIKAPFHTCFDGEKRKVYRSTKMKSARTPTGKFHPVSTRPWTRLSIGLFNSAAYPHGHASVEV